MHIHMYIHSAYAHPVASVKMMMMIAFITIKSSLVPLIEGLCAQIYVDLSPQFFEFLPER